MLLTTVHGNVYGDRDSDGVFNSAYDSGLESWVVFADEDGDGRYGASEVATLTDEVGRYTLDIDPGAIDSGTLIRAIPLEQARDPEAGLSWTTVSPQAGGYSVADAAAGTDLDFAVHATTPLTVRGRAVPGTTSYELELTADAGSVAQWLIDWGDASAVETVTPTDEAYVLRVVHDYGAIGSHDVTIRAVDDEGNTATAAVLTADWELDTAFGTSGVYTTSSVTSRDINDITALSDGGSVAIGTIGPASNTDVWLTRYDSAGNQIASLQIDMDQVLPSYLTAGLPSNLEQGWAVQAYEDDQGVEKVYFVSRALYNGTLGSGQYLELDLVVTGRLDLSNSGLALDTTFTDTASVGYNNLGVVAQFLDSTSIPDTLALTFHDMEVDSQGRILTAFSNSSTLFGMRMNPDGSMDSTFGTNGTVSYNIVDLLGLNAQYLQNPNFDLDQFEFSIMPADITTDGVVGAGGSFYILSEVDPFSGLPTEIDSNYVTRLDSAGSILGTLPIEFGEISSDPNADYLFSDLALAPNGDLIFAGYRKADTGTTDDLAVVRFTDAGQTVWTQHTDGIATTDATGGDDRATEVRVGPGGSITVIGQSDSIPGQTGDSFTIARFDASGNLDPSFGDAGVVSVDVTDDYATPTSFTVTPDGGYLVAGWEADPAVSLDEREAVITRVLPTRLGVKLGQFTPTFSAPSASDPRTFDLDVVPVTASPVIDWVVDWGDGSELERFTPGVGGRLSGSHSYEWRSNSYKVRAWAFTEQTGAWRGHEPGIFGIAAGEFAADVVTKIAARGPSGDVALGNAASISVARASLDDAAVSSLTIDWGDGAAPVVYGGASAEVTLLNSQGYLELTNAFGDLGDYTATVSATISGVTEAASIPIRVNQGYAAPEFAGPGVYLVPEATGNVDVQFNWVYNGHTTTHDDAPTEIGVFQVLDPQGRVEDSTGRLLRPGDDGYLDAALASGNATVIFAYGLDPNDQTSDLLDGVDDDTISTTFTTSGGTYLGFFGIQAGTLVDWHNRGTGMIPSGLNAWVSIAEGNADAAAHFVDASYVDPDSGGRRLGVGFEPTSAFRENFDEAGTGWQLAGVDPATIPPVTDECGIELPSDFVNHEIIIDWWADVGGGNPSGGGTTGGTSGATFDEGGVSNGFALPGNADGDVWSDEYAHEITSDPSGLFEVVGDMLQLREGASLDHETAGQHTVVVKTENVSNPGLPALEQTITVQVTDANEAPVFVTPVATGTIAEDSAQGSLVATFSATDADSGAFGGSAVFSIAETTTPGLFAIDPATGALTIADAQLLDFESASEHAVLIAASDASAPEIRSLTRFTLDVSDIAESPVASDATYAVEELALAGTIVGSVSAALDTGETASYSITAGNSLGLFEIDAATGVISVVDGSGLDLDAATTSFALTVQSDDGTMTSSSTVTINVVNKNEVPALADAAFGVSEHSAAGTVVGLLQATDADAGDSLRYVITAGNSGVYGSGVFDIERVDSRTANIVVADPSKLDFETDGSFDLTITVFDDGVGGLWDSASVTVTLTDVDEAPIVSAQTFAIYTGQVSGSTVGFVDARDPDLAADLRYSFQNYSAGTFSIDSLTGEITVAGTMTAGTSEVITVRVSDAVAPLWTEVSITIDMVGAPLAQVDGYQLDEQDLIAERAIDVIVPSGASRTLEFEIDDATWSDLIDGDEGDTFELALLDREGRSVVAAVPGTNALFVMRADGLEVVSEDAWLEDQPGGASRIVRVDGSSLPANAVYSLVARMVDGSGGVSSGSSVIVADDVQWTSAQAPTQSPPQTVQAVFSPYLQEPDADFDVLRDVTSGFDVEVVSLSRTSADTVRVELRLDANGTFSGADTIRGDLGPLLLGVQLTGGGSLGSIDGTTPDGTPYLDLSGLAFASDDFTIGALGDAVENVAFEVSGIDNPSDALSYDLTLFGGVNTAPTVIVPNEIVRDIDETGDFEYDVQWTDDSGKTPVFSLESPPAGATIDSAGRVTWPAANLQAAGEGFYLFRVVATDSYGAASEAASFVLNLSDIANGAPTFVRGGVAEPFTQAYANTPYVWTPTVSDPNGDSVTFSGAASLTDADGVVTDLVASGDLTINSSTGEISWTPTGDDVGGTVSVTLTVVDAPSGETPLEDTIEFDISVAQAIGNVAPEYLGSIEFLVEAETDDGEMYTGQGFSYSFQQQLEVFDQNGDPLTFELAAVNGFAMPTAIGLSQTGVLTWNASSDDAGSSYSVLVRAFDDAGGEMEQVITLTAEAPELPFTLRGTLFHDLDEDGVRETSWGVNERVGVIFITDGSCSMREDRFGSLRLGREHAWREMFQFRSEVTEAGRWNQIDFAYVSFAGNARHSNFVTRTATDDITDFSGITLSDSYDPYYNYAANPENLNPGATRRTAAGRGYDNVIVQSQSIGHERTAVIVLSDYDFDEDRMIEYLDPSPPSPSTVDISAGFNGGTALFGPANSSVDSSAPVWVSNEFGHVASSHLHAQYNSIDPLLDYILTSEEESGLSGWTVFADEDGDGELDAGERSAVTDAEGWYELDLPAGTHDIRVVRQSGWRQTSPTGESAAQSYAAQVVVGAGGSQVFDVDFGLVQGSDPLPPNNNIGGQVFVDANNNAVLDMSVFPAADPGHLVFAFDASASMDGGLAGQPNVSAFNAAITSSIAYVNLLLQSAEQGGLENPGDVMVSLMYSELAQAGAYALNLGRLAEPVGEEDQALVVFADPGGLDGALSIPLDSDVDNDGIPDIVNAFNEILAFQGSFFSRPLGLGYGELAQSGDAVTEQGLLIAGAAELVEQLDVEFGRSKVVVLSDYAVPSESFYRNEITNPLWRLEYEFGTDIHVAAPEIPAGADQPLIELVDPDGGSAGTVSGLIELLVGDVVEDVERPAVGWEVFIDLDQDGVVDAGEPLAVTGTDGTFLFTGLASGTYDVRLVRQAGYTVTTPSSDGLFESVQSGTTDLVFGVHDFTTPILPTFDDSTVPGLGLGVGLLTIGQRFTTRLVATDENGPDELIRYELATGPDGLTVHSSTGVLTWTPGADDIGSHLVIVRADDQVDGAGVTSFTLTVRDNQAPEIRSFGKPYEGDGQYVFPIEVVDDHSLEELSFRLENAPAGMTIDGTGVVRWNPETAGVTNEDVSFTVIVTDPELASDWREYTIAVRPEGYTDLAPVFEDVPLLKAVPGQSSFYVIRATDPEDGNLEVELDGVLPDNATYDSLSGMLVWTPSNDQLGQSQDFTFKAEDRIGNTTVETITIDVVAGLPVVDPEIISVDINGARVGELIEVTLSGIAESVSGEDHGVLWVDRSRAPSGMRHDPFTGKLAWIPQPGDVGMQRWELDALSYSNGVTTYVLEFEVFDAPRAPLFVGIEREISGSVTGGLAGSFVASDADGPDSAITYSLISAPAWLGINSGTGALEMLGTATTGTHTFDVRATDGDGLTTDRTIRADISASELPVVDLPSSIEVVDGVAFAADLVDLGLVSDADTASSLTFSVTSASGDFYFGTAGVVDPAVPVLRLDTPSTLSHNELITITVTDGAETVTRSTSVTVVGSNASPSVTGVPAEFVVEQGHSFAVNLSTYVSDTDDLAYFLAGPAPEGLRVDERTGVLRWDNPDFTTPAASPIPDEVWQQVRVVVTDPSLASADISFDLRLTEDVTAPVWSGASAQLVANLGTPLPLWDLANNDEFAFYAPWVPISVYTSKAPGDVGFSHFRYEIHTEDNPNPTATVDPLLVTTTIVETPSGTLDIGVPEVGSVEVDVYAVDSFGNVALVPDANTGRILIGAAGTPSGPVANTPPQVAFDPSWFDGSGTNVQYDAPPIQGIVQLTGLVWDEDGHDVDYTILYRKMADSSDVIQVDTSFEITDAWEQVGWFSGDRGERGDLNEFAPLMDPFDTRELEDGEYQFAIYATDGFGFRVVSLAGVDIANGAAKDPGFTLPFTDLSISNGSLPLTVQRTYDAERAVLGIEGDFGVGWSSNLQETDIEVTGLDPDTNAFTDNTVLRITLPDGNVATFAFAPTQTGGGLFGGGQLYAGFQQISDDVFNASLRFDGDSPALTRGSAGYTANGAPFNPLEDPDAVLRVRLAGGTAIYIQAYTSELIRIESATGERIESEGSQPSTSDEGMIERLYSTWTNDDTMTGMLRVILSESLIQRVESLAEDGSALSTVSYTYDAISGLLESVTDRAGNVTRLGYTQSGISDAPAGLLSTIYDPRSSEAASTELVSIEYDATGVVGRVTTADVFEYSSINLDQTGAESVSATQTLPVESVRDGRNRIIRQIAHLDREESTASIAESRAYRYVVTLFEYDELDRPIRTSQPFVVTGRELKYTLRPADSEIIWSQQLEFDGLNLVQITDENGLVTAFADFDDEGRPRVTIAPGGSVTTSIYDDYGRPLQTIDAEGGRTRNVYNDEFDTSGSVILTGSLSRVEQFVGGDLTDDANWITTSSFTYDEFGRRVTSTSVDGIVSYVGFDAFGRNSHNWTERGTLVSVSESLFDPQGRPIGGRSFEFQNPGGGFDVSNIDDILAVIDQSIATPLAPIGEFHVRFDSQGSTIGRMDSEGRLTISRLDARGAAVESREEVGRLVTGERVWSVTRSTYDATGRVRFQTDPFMMTTASTFYQNGLDSIGVIGEDTAPGSADEVILTSTADLFVTETIYEEGTGRTLETRRLSGLGIHVAFDTTYQNADGVYEASLSTATIPDPGAAPGTVVGGIEVVTLSETVYDDLGRVVETIIDRGSADEQRTYNVYSETSRLFQTVTTIDLDQNVSIDATDSDGDGIPETGSEALVTTYEYDAAGRQYRVTNPTGIVTESEFDKLGRVTGTKVSDGALLETTTSTSYDIRGRKVAETDQLSHVTNYEYDDAGRLIAVTLPSLTDPANPDAGNRFTYRYHYDQFGSRTAIFDPTQAGGDTPASALDDDPHTTFTNDDRGRQISRTLPEGQTEYMVFDDTLLADVTPGSLESSTARGQLAYSIDFEGNITKYLYDNTINGEGRAVTTEYYHHSAVGAISSQPTLGDVATAIGVSQPEQTVAIEYEDGANTDFGLVRRVTQSFSDPAALDRRIDFSYDEQGRTVRVETLIDAGSGFATANAVNYDYDRFDQIIRTFTDKDSNPDIQSPSYTPDTETTYGYDALGRIISTSATYRFAQDLSSTSGVETTTYFYDAMGALDREVHANDVITDYTYDSIGRLTGMTHYAPREVGGAPSNPDFTDNEILADFQYNLREDGRRVGAIERFDTDVSGTNSDLAEIRWLWEYDAANRLVTEAHDSDTAGYDYIHQYSFDNAGNRTQLTEYEDTSLDTTTFGSSSGGWLVLGSLPTASTAVVTSTYDDNDRLLVQETDYTDAGTPDERIEFDWGGVNNPSTVQLGRTEYVMNGGSWDDVRITTNSYDATGRLADVELDTDSDGSADTIIEYSYDSSGARVRQVSNPGTVSEEVTEFVIVESNPTGYSQGVEERDENGAIKRTYTIGLDVIADVVQGPSGDEVRTLLADGKGSTRALIDGMASLIKAANDRLNISSEALRLDYDAYGGAINYAAESTVTALLYSGEYTDSVTGQQYLRARHYDPSTGAFSRMDPFAGVHDWPQTLHKYAYGHSDPISYTDPSGNVVQGAILGAAGGFTVGALLGSAAGRQNPLTLAVAGALAGGILGGAVVQAPVFANKLIREGLEAAGWATVFNIVFDLADPEKDVWPVGWGLVAEYSADAFEAFSWGVTGKAIGAFQLDVWRTINPADASAIGTPVEPEESTGLTPIVQIGVALGSTAIDVVQTYYDYLVDDIGYYEREYTIYDELYEFWESTFDTITGVGVEAMVEGAVSFLSGTSIPGKADKLANRVVNKLPGVVLGKLVKKGSAVARKYSGKFISGSTERVGASQVANLLDNEARADRWATFTQKLLP